MIKNNLFYKAYALFLRIYFHIRFSPTIIGKENIPKKGACIIIANHRANHDFLSLGIGTKRTIHFLVKDTLFKGVLKILLNSIGAIPVNRKSRNPEAIERSLCYLKKGEIIGLFPEGTFNKTNDALAPFKTGAIRLAYKSKCKIIPIVIIGKYKRKKLKIIIKEPYEVTSNDYKLETSKLRELMKDVYIKGETWNY